MSLEQKLKKYILASDEPLNCFELGYEYELIEQYASAMGYYLKCAELTKDDRVAYHSLLRKARCFDALPDREAHVRSCCLLAIGILPNRPEAYHLLSVSYEHDRLWQESYAWASAAQRLNGIAKGDILGTDVNYPGHFVLPFQEAVALWWIGRFDESLEKFHELSKVKGLTPEYKSLIQWNIDNLEGRIPDESDNSKSITDKEDIIKKILAKQGVKNG